MDDQARREIHRVYARLPDMEDCQGKCWDSCTSIDMSPVERERLRQLGYEIPPVIPAAVIEVIGQQFGRVPRCPALSALGTCRVYDDRPLICRAFGTTVGLPCKYGCKPKRLVSDYEFGQIFLEIEDISERWESRHDTTESIL